MSERVGTSYMYGSLIGNINRLNYDYSALARSTGASSNYESFSEIKEPENIRSMLYTSFSESEIEARIAGANVAKMKINEYSRCIDDIYQTIEAVASGDIGYIMDDFGYNDVLPVVAEGALGDITSILNCSIGGSYIFSGSKVLYPAVADLREIDVDMDEIDFSSVDDYVEDFIEKYYLGDKFKSRVILDDNYELEYGITADHPSIAKLLIGLKALAEEEVDGDADKRRDARNLVLQSAGQVLRIRDFIELNASIINRYEGRYASIIGGLHDIRGGIESEDGVDILSTLSKQRVDEVALSASNYMLMKMKDLSILNSMKGGTL